MKKGTLDTLAQGIVLEKSETVLPWKTRFEKLKKFGQPEVKKCTGSEMIVWRNERILGGLTVDLNVWSNRGFLFRRNRLKNVSAYISESDFELAKKHLDEKVGMAGRYEQLNDVEYCYCWKIGNCEVSLSHLDRFGSFWKLDVNRQFSLSDLLPAAQRFRNSSGLQKLKNDLFVTFFYREPQPVSN